MGEKESATARQSRSAQTRKRRAAKKRESDSYEQRPEELGIDDELTALGGFRILRELINLEEEG